MKTTFLFCLMLGVSALSHPTGLVDGFDVELEEQWTLFKQTYNRQYASQEEESMRKSIFERNLKLIQMHNLMYSRGLKSFKMALNEFSDKAKEEISFLRGVSIPTNYNRTGVSYLSPLNIGELPKEIDWRTKGLVTEVGHQENCGSCYAFSAVGAIEAQHARKTGQLLKLSVQNIVDCSSRQGNYGCDSGKMDQAFDYVIQNRGIATDETYPYVDYEQRCLFKKSIIGATISSYVSIEKGNERQLIEAVATVGPISVAIHANEETFIHYSGGIYDKPDCKGKRLDHAVLIVGYGTENGRDYWIVKNSWGTNWGEEGYFRMLRNDNHCGIADFAVYPIV